MHCHHPNVVTDAPRDARGERGDRHGACPRVTRSHWAAQPSHWSPRSGDSLANPRWIGLPTDARSPLIGRVDAYRAQLLAESGATAAAREVATQLPAGRRRSVVEIRCELADKNGQGGRSGLERLASRNATPREALEYALLDARVALEEAGSAPSGKLQRVLDLGRASGFIRTLADEGADLAAALAKELRHQPNDAYSDA